ncbi:MAG TPA: hypothetical protein PK760_04485, partial [Flavobacteriales bacterium]|nr:hypothetical protein [Flavobacteriales bacterium]
MLQTSLPKALCFFLVSSAVPVIAQDKYLFARFGIADIDLRKQADVFLLPDATLEISRFGDFLSGATGVDFIGAFSEGSRWHYECGLYYNSTTLVGNPQFRLKYTSTQTYLDTTAFLNVDYEYGNFKAGVGYRLSNPEHDFIFMPALGLDMEYGRITLVSDVVRFSQDANGGLVPENITPDAALLLGLYGR